MRRSSVPRVRLVESSSIGVPMGAWGRCLDVRGLPIVTQWERVGGFQGVGGRFKGSDTLKIPLKSDAGSRSRRIAVGPKLESRTWLLPAWYNQWTRLQFHQHHACS